MPVADLRIEEFLGRGNDVTDAVASTARVAAKFLPKYELPPTTKSVTSDRISGVSNQVDDVTTIPLTEIRVRFALDWNQLAGPDLATALYIARKSAQAYCRLEDRLIFRGQGTEPGQLPFGPGPQAVDGTPGGEVERGYAGLGLERRVPLRPAIGLDDIYAKIARAYRELEDQAATGPWAIVMGTELFDRSDVTNSAFIQSPRERIENLLSTKIHRSSVLETYRAFIMGGAMQSESNSAAERTPASPVDRAVALEPQLRFLDRTDAQGRYEFVVLGSLALRVRDTTGILQIEFIP